MSYSDLDRIYNGPPDSEDDFEEVNMSGRHLIRYGPNKGMMPFQQNRYVENRIDRAMSESITCHDIEYGDGGVSFTVRGSTGQLYEIQFVGGSAYYDRRGHWNDCDCPDFCHDSATYDNMLCKHCYFVITRVLKFEKCLRFSIDNVTQYFFISSNCVCFLII